MLAFTLTNSPTLWLPLLAAVLFSGAALLMRHASSYSLDTWRISFAANLVTGLVFQFFWLRAGALPNDWLLFWQPLVVASLFIVGQAFTLTALSQGDISVAAPVLGLKLVFVPFYLTLFSDASLPPNIWLACGLATLGVILLNYTQPQRRSHVRTETASNADRKRVLFSIVTALLGASCFALFDVCVQLRSPKWSGGAFLPVVFLLSTFFTLGFIPFFPRPLREVPKPAIPSLLGAACLFASQSMAIVCAVAFWGNAAAANVVYSTRGLWSIIVVGLLGRSLGISDTGLQARVFAIRLAGAVTVIASIVVLALE